MSEIKTLLKRAKTLKAKKDARSGKKSPDLVILYYDEFRKIWAVKESFFRRGGSGQVVFGGVDKKREIKNYNTYVFDEYNHATRVIIDTISCPHLSEEEQDIFNFMADDIRRELKVTKDTPYSIDRIYTDEDGESVCDVVIYEREEQ